VHTNDSCLNASMGEGLFGFPTSDEHEDGEGFVASDFEFRIDAL
jgi:hypothetical protein